MAEEETDVFEALKSTLAWEASEIILTGNDKFPELQAEVDEIRQKLKRIHEKIIATEAFLQKETGFSKEANQQLLRLESINLFKTENNYSNQCPFCNSSFSAPIPSLSAIRESLRDLQNNIRNVEVRQPRLLEYIEQLKEQREEIRGQIQEKELAIKAVINEQEAAQKIRDNNAQIARIVGRISLYLETVEFADENSQIRLEIEKLKKLIADYEQQLDTREIKAILASILNRIGQQMTEWAKRLQLEHSDSPYRFDL